MHEYDLEEIKREIVESRSLTIKTNNLVNALAADLKSIAKRQQGYERKIFVHSVTAYLVVVAVIMILSKLALDAQVEAVREEGRAAREELVQIEKSLAAVEKREEARLLASRKAAELYQLVTENKRPELLERLPELAKLDLSPTERAVFEQAAQRSRMELSLIAYQAGLDHARAQRWHEAMLSFRESLELHRDAPHAPQATYELARAQRQLGRQKEAIPLLMSLTEASADKEVLDEATFLLAECQLDIEAWNDAKATLRNFIRRFPRSPLLNEARSKLSEVNLRH